MPRFGNLPTGPVLAIDELRINQALRDRWINRTYPAVRTATCVIAASNAPDFWKAQADLVVDGVDDQVALMAALIAYRNIKLSPGTFFLSAEWLIEGLNSWSIRGANRGGSGTILRLHTAGQSGIRMVNDGANNVFDWLIEDVRIDGNALANTTGIDIQTNTSLGIVRNVYIEDCTDWGVDIQQAWTISFENCWLRNNGVDAITGGMRLGTAGGSVANIIRMFGMTFSFNSAGLSIGKGDVFDIVGCGFSSHDYHGIAVDADANSVSIDTCYFESNALAGGSYYDIYIAGDRVTVRGGGNSNVTLAPFNIYAAATADRPSIIDGRWGAGWDLHLASNPMVVNPATGVALPNLGNNCFLSRYENLQLKADELFSPEFLFLFREQTGTYTASQTGANADEFGSGLGWAAIGQLKGITFDESANGYLGHFTDMSGNWTVGFVLKPDYAYSQNSNKQWFSWGISGTQDHVGIRHSWGNTSFEVNTGGGNVNFDMPEILHGANEILVVIATFDAATGTFMGYINGFSKTAVNALTSIASVSRPVRFGKRSNNDRFNTGIGGYFFKLPYVLNPEAARNLTANLLSAAGRNIRMENEGTATIPNAATSVVVNHGLPMIPTGVWVGLINSGGNATKVYADIAEWTATQFTIRSDVDPGAATAVVKRKAVVGEGN